MENLTMLPASTLDEENKSSPSRATTGESSEFNPVDERQDACMGHVENKSENTSNVREAIVSFFHGTQDTSVLPQPNLTNFAQPITSVLPQPNSTNFAQPNTSVLPQPSSTNFAQPNVAQPNVSQPAVIQLLQMLANSSLQQTISNNAFGTFPVITQAKQNLLTQSNTSSSTSSSATSAPVSQLLVNQSTTSSGAISAPVSQPSVNQSTTSFGFSTSFTPSSGVSLLQMMQNDSIDENAEDENGDADEEYEGADEENGEEEEPLDNAPVRRSRR
jgi:hypothetical protein